MDLDSLILHFFDTVNPNELSEEEFALALERLKIAFGVERDPGRKFALWTLLETAGMAPPPAEAFAKEPALKAAAEDFLRTAWRVERDGQQPEDE